MCQNQIDWVWFKFWIKNVFSPAWGGTSELEVGKDGSWASQVLSLWTFIICTFISKLNPYEYQCQDCLFCREAHQAEVGRAKEVEEQLAEAYRFFRSKYRSWLRLLWRWSAFVWWLFQEFLRTSKLRNHHQCPSCQWRLHWMKTAPCKRACYQ